MNPRWHWALAVLAVAAGFALHGWKGVVLALTMIVFWLLLQFGRSLRVMQRAGRRPVGTVDSAVMLHSRLERGMTLMQILGLTGSLGRRQSETPERWVWADPAGASVTLTLVDARLAHWELQRPDE